MVTKIHDGANWKNINGLKLYNGTSWRNATKGWIWNGSLWKQWYPEYPINTSSPTVSGSTTQGQTLSVTNGSWNTNLAYNPTSYTYAWARNGTIIPGATSSTYTTVTADIGNPITCLVTAVNNRGTTPVASSNSITIVAQTYTISYAGNGSTGGSAPTSPTSVNSGSTFTTPSNTYSRTGYTFAGWLSSQNSTTYSAGVTHPAATGNITLTAQWTANTQTISYAGNSNTGGSAPTSPTTVSYGSTFTTPSNTYSRTGYTFAGWLSSQNSTTYSAGVTHPAATGNITLTAQWTANTLTVTWNSQGGSAINSTTTTTGGTVSNPGSPTRSGYTFNGWFTSTSGGTAISFPYTHGQTANFTLYAQWTQQASSVGSTSFVSITADGCPGTNLIFTPATNATCYDFYWANTNSAPSSGTTPDYSCQSAGVEGSNRYVYLVGIGGARYWWVRGKDGSGNTGPWSTGLLASTFGGC